MDFRAGMVVIFAIISVGHERTKVPSGYQGPALEALVKISHSLSCFKAV
jgi:hypothetical protein